MHAREDFGIVLSASGRDVMKFWISLFACLSCGVLCVWAAVWLLHDAGRPELFLRLIPKQKAGQQQLALQFINLGKKDVSLNSRGMEIVVYHPDNAAQMYTVYAQSAGSDGDITIPPGRSADIGDVLPLVKNLPGGSLVATYSNLNTGGTAWHGTVRSPVLPIDRK